MNRNLWLLVACQGLYLTNNVTFIAINGLVGVLVTTQGWRWLNYGSLAPVALIAAALLWLGLSSRAGAAPAKAL